MSTLNTQSFKNISHLKKSLSTCWETQVRSVISEPPENSSRCASLFKDSSALLNI